MIKTLRNTLLGVIGIVFLIFCGVAILAIWGFYGGDTLAKSVESMGLLFCSAAVILAALQSQLPSATGAVQSISLGKVLAMVFLGLVALSILSILVGFASW